MKKLLILALVALVAGSAFATTDPAFSGEFEFFAGFDFVNEQADFGDSGEAVIELNGVVDEYSTVNAELSAETVDGTEPNLTLNAFTMTTDITGALGVAGPAGVAITWGYQTFEATTYSDVAGYEDTGFSGETAGYVSTLVAITVGDSITINGWIVPGSYTDWDGVNEAVGAVEILYVMDAVSAGAYFTYDANAGPVETGFTMSYVTDMLEAGLGLEYDMTVDGAETFTLGVAFLYNVTDAWAAGLAFGTGDMLNSNFASTSLVALNTEYDVNDMFQLYASFVMANFESIDLRFEGGVAIALGGVTYTIGYDYGGADFKAPDWALAEGLYLKVSASF